MSDFSGVTISNYKRFIWQDSRGQAALPKPNMVHNQCTEPLQRVAVKDPSSSGLCCSCAYLYSQPRHFHSQIALSEAFGRSSSGVSVEASSQGEVEETLKTLSPILNSYSGLFLSLFLSLILFLTSGSIKLLNQ